MKFKSIGRRSIVLNVLVCSMLSLFIFSGCNDTHEPEPARVTDTSKMDDYQKHQVAILEEDKRNADSDAGSCEKKINDLQQKKIAEASKRPTLKGDIEKALDFENIMTVAKVLSNTMDKTVDEEIAELTIQKSDAEIKSIKIQKEINKIVQESQKSCFPKGTQVLLSDGKYKEISSIKEGDSVMAYDIAKDTLVESPVKHVYIDDNNHYYTLNDAIKATAYERFLTKESGWKKIRELKVGDEIFNGNSYEVVKKIEKVRGSLTVYNLNIEASHNFFVANEVGDTTLLVHNTGGGGSGGGGK